jgi:hypothetical protein
MNASKFNGFEMSSENPFKHGSPKGPQEEPAFLLTAPGTIGAVIGVIWDYAVSATLVGSRKLYAHNKSISKRIEM